MREASRGDQERITQHFIETMQQLQNALSLGNEKSRDQSLDGIVQFLPAFRDKVNAIKNLLAASKELQTKEEGRHVYGNTQLFLLKSKVQDPVVRKMLSDLFLVRYVQHRRIRKGIEPKQPARVFERLLSDAHINARDLSRLTTQELLKNILLHPVIESSLPPDESGDSERPKLSQQKIFRLRKREV